MGINVQTKTRGARIKNLLATRWDIVKVKKMKSYDKELRFRMQPALTKSKTRVINNETV